MKRLTVVFAVTMGLAVATMAGLWTSSSASAGGFEDGLKCYRTLDVHSKLSGDRLIYISDQFEEKNLLVKKPISFCARADKSLGAGSETAGEFARFEHLVCYAIKYAPGQPRFRPEEVFVQDQFSEGSYRLTKPYGLCEPADKTIVPDNQAAGNEPFEDFAFKCYQVRRNEHGSTGKIEISVRDQFEPGGKDVRLGRPIVFCTQVEEKKNKAKNNHIENARTLNSPEDEHHASTISATRGRDDPEISCADSYGHSVWYTYTTGGSPEKVTITTEGSTYDTVLAIFGSEQYNGGGGGIDIDEEIACNDDENYPSSGHSRVDAVKLLPNSTYYIVVGAFGSDQGGKLKLSFDLVGQCSSCTASATAPDVGEASGGPDWNLMCYAISQRAPEDVLLQTIDQLNAHQFELGRGNMYCTPAAKCMKLVKKSAGDAALAGESPFICRQP